MIARMPDNWHYPPHVNTRLRVNPIVLPRVVGRHHREDFPPTKPSQFFHSVRDAHAQKPLGFSFNSGRVNPFNNDIEDRADNDPHTRR